MLLLAVAASCADRGSSRAACSVRAPERTVDAPLGIKDLSLTIPAGTVDTDADGRPDEVQAANGVVSIQRGDGTLTLTTAAPVGVTIRAWADLDGDGRDDVLIDDGPLRVIDGRTPDGSHDVDATGIRVSDELVTIWPGDLDGVPGADFYVPHRLTSRSTTDVYSGAAVLDHPPGGDARDVPIAKTLPGLPRSLARLEPGGRLETVLLDPGPPSTLSFAPRRRAPLRVDLGTSHRVEWVQVFDERGVRKITLQIDRKVAVWPVPRTCSSDV